MKLFTRRITALLLVVCLIVPMLPAYAEGTQTNADNVSKAVSATLCSKIFDFALNETIEQHFKKEVLL